MTAGRRVRGVLRWLVPALLVVAWLGLGGVLGPFTGKLAEVQTNDAAAFLPADAESTRVADVQRRVSGQDALPAIAVFEYDTAVTEADLAVIEELADEIAQIDGVVGDPAPPVPSEDGRAVQLILQVDAAQGAAAGDVVA
ncbi:MAG TPA: MMPL family transporter, partial [Jiangellaceae bacterium]|nr:MMPL family transporter [Jiangellaceae bacterium]